MCAANNTSTTKQGASSTTNTKPIPKWLKMKQQNRSSADKSAKPIVKKSSGSAQKANKETRNAKRARWAKKAKPVAKARVIRGPMYEYTSVCCGLPVTKPRCGLREPVQDPETGKMKDKVKGLGKWRCNGVGGCKKPCRVIRNAPKPKDTGIVTSPVSPYPGKLETPVIGGANA